MKCVVLVKRLRHSCYSVTRKEVGPAFFHYIPYLHGSELNPAQSFSSLCSLYMQKVKLLTSIFASKCLVIHLQPPTPTPGITPWVRGSPVPNLVRIRPAVRVPIGNKHAQTGTIGICIRLRERGMVALLLSLPQQSVGQLRVRLGW